MAGALSLIEPQWIVFKRRTLLPTVTSALIGLVWLFKVHLLWVNYNNAPNQSIRTMVMFIYNVSISFVLDVSDEGDVGKNGFKNNLLFESCHAVTVY